MYKYNRRIRFASVFALLVAILLLGSSQLCAQNDPLPSWNDGPAKQAILDFVRTTTDPLDANCVAPESRIAVFDNDGTLWVEQPLYPQVVFVRERLRALASRHPDWSNKPPFRAFLSADFSAMARLSGKDFERIVAAAVQGMTVEGFQATVSDWFATARQPRFQRRYTELVYQPMLEVMKLFRDYGYKTYIVTGGEQDFVRAFAEPVYGVPPEQVVGSVFRTKYERRDDGRPVLIKLPVLALSNDKAGKPEGINLMIGRRPLAAFGNSTGDQEMLEWTQAGPGKRLMMLVHHDDAEREYAYGANSPIGSFPDALMAEARRRGWVVISMKDDWKRIFPFEE
jgi:phosphoglycolate phosphatase-like HAD superfamily hydrolase